MSLNHYERLNLIHQLSILKGIGSELYSPNKIDQMISVLQEGHTALYDEEIFDSLFFNPVSSTVTENLNEILYLHHHALESFNRLSERIHADQEERLSKSILFLGFNSDDYSEEKYHRQAVLNINKLGAYESFIKDDKYLNVDKSFTTNSSMLPVYKERLDKYKELKIPHEELFTLSDLEYIFS